MKKKIQFTAIIVMIVVGLGFLAYREYESKQDLVFAEALDEVAVTVDGRELTLEDLAFYIAYQEQQIEKAARIYNPEDTGEYWNVYTNHTFLREEGKSTAMNMAVHDEIFYQLAEAEGLELSAEEEQYLANDLYDFWSDLEEEQRMSLGVGEDVLAESMRKIALAEKYQYLLAAMEQKKFEDYSIAGTAYEKMLGEHTYEVKEAVWDRVRFGGVTVNH